jgi:hypothetical protein
MDQNISADGDKADIWNKVLRTAMNVPGARVDRSAYLQRELANYVGSEQIEAAIAMSPQRAGIPPEIIRKISESTIAWHKTGVTTTSIAAGIPGGWWMAGTIPADLTQYFWHVIVVLQKLAYLHGWPELLKDGQELDDETLHVLTIFVGVMLGAAGAGKVLADLAERISKEVIVRLPKEALTKWGLYTLAKEIAKWIGVKLTKEGFARIVAKAIPLISGAISGAITWWSFSRMSARLHSHLENLRPHTGGG